MTRATPPRPAFTLVEMLTTVSIIGVLIALSAGAFVRVRAAQTVSNTEGTLSKLDSVLQSRWHAVVDQAKRTVPPALVAKCGGDRDRAAALWVYATLKNEFPMSFKEATTPIDFGGGAALQPRNIFKAVAAGPALPTPEGEAAALFYAAITQGGNAGNVADADGLNNQVGDFAQLDAATQKVLTAPVPTYKDGWGYTITFVRHANAAKAPEINGPPYTRATRLTLGSTPANVLNTLDPTGRLSAWPGTPNVWLAQQNFLSGTPNQVFVDNVLKSNVPAFMGWQTIDYRQNTVPTLVSAGANKVFGANPLDPVADDSADNLLSYRLRREGDKGN